MAYRDKINLAMDKQILFQLLADNQLNQLFAELKNQQGHFNNDLILLESQWNDLRSKERNGTLSNEQVNLENARIRKGLLDLIEQAFGKAPQSFHPSQAGPSFAVGKKWLLVAGMVVLMLSLLYGYSILNGNAPSDEKASAASVKSSVVTKSKTLDTSKAQPITLAPGDFQYERVYSVIKTSTESTGGGKSLISIRVGLNFKGIINHLFGTEDFRLVSDQLPGPLAPSNFFSTVIDSKSYGEDNVQFELSDEVKEFSIIIEGKEDKKWVFSR